MRLMQFFESDEDGPVRIKLSGWGSSTGAESTPADSYIEDLYDMGNPHPFNDKVVTFGPVGVEMSAMGDDVVHLHDIISYEQQQSGHGTKVLQKLMQLANRHGVVIDAHAKAYSNDPRHQQDNHALLAWYVKNGFTVTNDIDVDDYGAEIEYDGRGSMTESEDVPREIMPPAYGVKLRKGARIWRGVSDESGSGGAVYGMGLYTTTSKQFAAKYGNVIEMDRWDDLPGNPMRFRTNQEWEIWLQNYDQYNGILGARDRGAKHNDIGEYIRIAFPEADGIQIGLGNEAIFVAWPV